MPQIPAEDHHEGVDSEEEDSLNTIAAARIAWNECPQGHPRRAQACTNLALSIWEHCNQFPNQQLLNEAIDVDREALDLCPQGHPHHARSCRNLAASLRLHYEYTGDQQLLAESVDLERRTLVLCPQGHPHHAVSCGNLAASLRLLYQLKGDQQVLAESIDLMRKSLALCPQGHPHHALSCSNLAVSLHLRYEHTGDQQLLSESIDLKRKALALYPPGHPNHAESCQNLAASLGVCYEHTGDQQVLVESIDLMRKALGLCSQGLSNHARYCRSLAASLGLLYEHTGDQQLLTECIDLERKALALCPSGHPDHALSCQNLAVSLQLSYERTGNQRFLSESVDLKRKALALCPLGHPDHALSCQNLAASLHLSYEYIGDQQLLSESIDLKRKALALCPPGHPDHALSCRNLGASLWLRYQHTGDQQLLTEAIDLDREALALCPQGHPQHALSCRNLAASLWLRFQHTGDQQLLSEAIDLMRKALNLCPPGHPDHAISCRNLAVSLHLLYEHTDNQQLLSESIDLKRKALDLCPQGHPHHALSCRDLAVSLDLHYKHTGDQQLLAEAIDLKRKALVLCPPSHPDHAQSCWNLAASLCLRYEYSDDQQFLEEAVELYKESALYDAQSTHWRSLMGLAEVYIKRGTAIYDMSKSIEHLLASLGNNVTDSIPDIVNRAILNLNQMWRCGGLDQLMHPSFGQIYRRLLVFLPLLAHPVFNPQDQLRALKQCSNVGPDAFIDATLMGDKKSGIEMLELIQGLVWSQLLHHRDPQLDDVPAHLANELKMSLWMLHQPTLLPATDQLSTAHAPRDIQHHLSIRVQALMREIRALPGLDRFMLGESFESLCAVALKYPVVVLVNARGYSYALILSAGPRSGAQVDDRCSLLRLNIDAEEIVDLSISSTLTRYSRGSEGPNEVEDHGGGRGIGISSPSTSAAWTRRMKTIWEKIVQPILGYLGLQPSNGRSRPRLYWCPTGIFSRLPLHAAGIYSRSQGVSCSDLVVSTYTPTLTSLLRAQKQAPTLLQGNISLALIAEKCAQEPNLNVIPQVNIELEQVMVAAQSSQVQLSHRITGSTTVGGVSTAIKDANVIHLACHGIQDPNDATKSGFCLGDGRLTIEHLMDLSVANPFLAFLSACETAKGDINQPDQVMHLAAAMLFCGFKSIVATMWAIHDLDGPKVAKWFYEELFASEAIDVDSVAYALDVAVGKLRDSRVPPDRWAPFIHMGA